MTSIDSNYQLSQMHYERQGGADRRDQIPPAAETFLRTGERKGVRTEILEELMMSPEFEEVLAAYQAALTSIIAKWGSG
ncbi:hypothetical protein [Klebsiella pneumoniae]|uniref:hypothetical protein n=1 Tax=Klebsiella pneumoniae TaxID=573 RepID=UPI0007C61997|nr:hypothetical protein [Klebsiella pneumoniae]CZQ42625.1 hypothetical protein RH201207_00117 [Klebsiella pneumoniae]